MNLSTVCLAASVAVFALAAASISFGVPMIALGLALFAAGHLRLP